MSKQANFSRKLTLDSPERKPSVFERLGTKSCVVSGKNVCPTWAQSGTCPLNKLCKLSHANSLINLSKRSKVDTMKKSLIVHKKSKDEHKKSLRSHQSSEPEWEGWELGDLEDADEKVLEKRKQELQRELQLQLKKEKELTRKKDKKTEKKRALSTSSSSTTTSETSTSSTSSSSSSEPKKRQNRKRKHASSSSDSEASPQRRKKSPKTVKAKATAPKKPEKKDRITSEGKNKSVVVTKKSVVQKKSYSPGWEKSRARSPIKQQTSRKSPHHSPDSKNKSSSPRYDKTIMKTKNRGYSPKQKTKEITPKRILKKNKEQNTHLRDKSRQSPSKARVSPSRLHKVSPGRSRRHEESSDKRRGHHEERKHSPRRDRSREKDRKKDTRGARSNDDNNGGLKKGGKIAPLKSSSFSKGGVIKKDTAHHKTSDKSLEPKSKEEDGEKERNRGDRDKERSEKEKSRCERDRSKHKKANDEHDRRSARERDSDRTVIKGRDERCRDREGERFRFAKEREAERQKERDEALERCRERQKERERLEKERKEKEDKKHQRGTSDNKSKDHDRELPSLLDLKAENPRNHGDATGFKNSEKHLSRDNRRNIDKGNDKCVGQDREGRDRGTPDKDPDRRDSRRSDENERRIGEKDYEGKRNREDLRSSSELRRSTGDGRRIVDDGGEPRRPWDDMRRIVDSVHDRRRSLDPAIGERRQHALARRPVDDHYRRGRAEDLEIRDFQVDERRNRKLIHNCSDWDSKDQKLDYRDPEIREDWNHSERHHDWNARYDQKWVDHEEALDNAWNHYARRPGLEEWNNDWPQEKSRPSYSEEEHLDVVNGEFPDRNGKKQGTEPIRNAELHKDKENSGQKVLTLPREKSQKGDGDALSDISDDPDDILNQDDEAADDNTTRNNAQNSGQQIYIRSDEFLFDQRRPLLECLGERALDFEEISDEELEEEARVSKGIVDVLGADWAGLVQETRPRPKRFEGSGSGHRRWVMNRIVSRLGISAKYAGQDFINKLADKYKSVKVEESREDQCENKNNEKPIMNEGEGKLVFNLPGTLELGEEKSMLDTKPAVGIDLYHSIPALHNVVRESLVVKSCLFPSYNRFKRALSARTDLNLRRELCNLPSREPLHFTPPLDNKMYEASVQLFQNKMTTAAV